jgi:hypothetical protein
MAKRIYELAVKVGEYQKDGETKGRFMSVGSVMQSDDGGQFIMLNRAFNPAGVPVKDPQSDSVLIGCYTPKPKPGAGSGPAKAAPSFDDTPF